MPLNPTTLLQQDDVMSRERMNTYVFGPLTDLIHPAQAFYNKPITDPNITTASTSFVALDATNFSLTITSKGNPLLLTHRGYVTNASVGAATFFELYINGNPYGGGAGGIWAATHSTASAQLNASFTEIINFSAGTYTIQLYWRASAGTSTYVASYYPQFSVREL